ncbi:MAG: hypothetical protein PF482_14480 [Desulfobacteraceae bacterium]|nr:hypothetical protein [Desulfobacteraceae bacterium]
MRKQRLKKMADVRRFLSKIINQLDGDEIAESKCRTLAYGCSVLKTIIETGDLETRLEALERDIKK